MQTGSKSPRKAFTLIELMVTIAVLAVLLVAAGPSFADFFERYRLRSAVDDTVNLFVAARQGAVEADRNVNVTFGSDVTNWCVGAVQQDDPGEYQPVVTTPGSCGCSTTTCIVNGEVLVVDAMAHPSVTMAAGAGSTFTYDSKRGTVKELAVPVPVDFESSSKRYGLRVMVSALGQARACVIPGKRPIPGYSQCPS